jgi:hypothetical protein
MRLIDALKKRFQTPEQALEALGLDAATIALDAAIRPARDNKEKATMTIQSKWSPTALVAMGALQNYLNPRLAQDAAINLRPILKDVTAKNFTARRPYVTSAIRAAVSGNLAQDADIEDLPEILDNIEALAGEASQAVGGEAGPDDGNPMADPVDEDAGGDPDDAGAGDPDVAAGDPDAMQSGESDANEIEDFLRDKLDPADLDTVCAMMKAAKAGGAVDEDNGADLEAGKPPAMDKKAMDAAIKTAVEAAVARVEKNHNAVAEAQRMVRPYVGDLSVAFDSAEAVYRHTLTAMGVNVKDTHPDALPAILAAQPKPGARRSSEARIAHDEAAAKGFSERFPSASHIRTM